MRTIAHNMLRFIDTPSEGEGGDEQPDTTDEADEGSSGEAADIASEKTDDAPEAWDQSRALEKIRKANAEAKSLRERAKAAESKVKGLDDVTRERDELAAKVLRLETAAKFNLPPQVAARLQGSTAEEMAQDAEALLELFGPRTPPSQTPRPATGSTGGREEKQHVETPDEVWARMRSQRR